MDKATPKQHSRKKRTPFDIIKTLIAVLLFALIVLTSMFSVNLFFEIENSHKESRKLDLEIKQLEYNLRYKEVVNSTSERGEFIYRKLDRQTNEMLEIYIGRAATGKWQLEKHKLK